MGTERNMSSVLAKLMGIDKPSNSCTSSSNRRHRVLSENYLQNVASVARREKAWSYSAGTECDMDVTEGNSRGANVIEHKDFRFRTGQSFLPGRSFSSSKSSSSDRNGNSFVSELNNGVHARKKRMNNSYNSIKSPIQGSLSSKEIAKQISGEVRHSAWHNCAELSRCNPGSETSFEIEEEERVISSAIQVNLEKKFEASSYNSVNGSKSTTQKAKTRLSEKWRTRKCSEVVVKSNDGICSITSSTASVNGWPVHGARYLSKPALFPSAWVPRSRERRLNLDKNWCLGPEKRDSKQCSDMELENYGHENVQAMSKSSICSLDLQKPCSHQEDSLNLNDSVNLVEQNSTEETFKVTESLNNSSACSEVESQTCHKTNKITNENGCGHLEKEDGTVVSLCLNCSVASISLEEEEAAFEGIKNKNMSTKVLRDNLSAKPTACILLGDNDSWKNQSKIISNGSEPGSPVSSLEGPEACRHVFNFTLKAEEESSVSDPSENDAHGLQNKLQLIETMSLESGSEGCGMVVSSEEGEDGRSIGCYQKDPQILELDQTLIKESCDFSYIVDVVVESGLQIRNLETESKTWWLQGYALDPLVFELLEKKYGQHVPWAKSERMLLFDRINSLLLDKVKPMVGSSTWKKPVAKRFCPRQKVQEFIEDELWWLLVNQEEEVKKESFDKVCRIEKEWLDLEEDTDLIVQDVQSLLMDELIEEFVHTEICF